MVSPFWAKSLLLGALLAYVGPAAGADHSSAEPATPKPAPLPWTFGIEGSAEFFAIDNGSHQAGDFDDAYYRLSLSRRFADHLVGGISFEHAFKTDDKDQYYAEATLGYRFGLSESFSLTPGIGAGYTWGDTGVIKGSNSEADIAYYLVSLAGDLKIAPKFTWTVFNVRYRNGFDATWLTPKVATGLTYDIDDQDAVYLNVGYEWKKTATTSSPYNELAGDKFGIALGYKRSF